MILYNWLLLLLLNGQKPNKQTLNVCFQLTGLTSFITIIIVIIIISGIIINGISIIVYYLLRLYFWPHKMSEY